MPVQRTPHHRRIPDPPHAGPTRWHTVQPDVIRSHPRYRQEIRDMPVEQFLSAHSSLERSGHGPQARAMSEVAHSIPQDQFRHRPSQGTDSPPPADFRDGILRHPLERQYPRFHAGAGSTRSAFSATDPAHSNGPDRRTREAAEGLLSLRMGSRPTASPQENDLFPLSPLALNSPHPSPFNRSGAPSPVLGGNPLERNPSPPPNTAAHTPGGILMPTPVRRVHFEDMLAGLENRTEAAAGRPVSPGPRPSSPVSWRDIHPTA